MQQLVTAAKERATAATATTEHATAATARSEPQKRPSKLERRLTFLALLASTNKKKVRLC